MPVQLATTDSGVENCRLSTERWATAAEGKDRTSGCPVLPLAFTNSGRVPISGSGLLGNLMSPPTLRDTQNSGLH